MRTRLLSILLLALAISPVQAGALQGAARP